MGSDAGDMSDAEQRTGHRQRVLKGGTILLGVYRSEIACVVRNMHKDGAELKVGVEEQLPQEFLLYVPVDKLAYRCVLVWRTGLRAGVQFVGTEPKPSWHYG